MSDIEADDSFVRHDQDVKVKNYARFYPKWVRNNFQSDQQGTEIGEYRDYVMILCPGQKDEFHRQATKQDKETYREEWSAYKASKDQRISGTPIELLPGIDVGRISSLKSLHIYSIEQMATLSDLAMQQVGIGAQDLRQRAKAFLAKKPDPAEVDTLRARVAELEALVATLQANQRKKPGPKKQKAEPESVS